MSLFKKIVVLFLCAVCQEAYSGAGLASNIQRSDGLEWQKVELESQLVSKISRAISSVVLEGQSIVNVTVVLRDKERRTHGQSSGSKVSLGKLGLDSPLIGTEEDDQNLFKNISGITASILLDEAVSDDKEETIENVTREIIDAVGHQYKGFKSEVKLDRAVLQNKDPKSGSW